MKRLALVVVLALVLTFAFATSAFATTGKFYQHSTSYYKWTGGQAVDIYGDGSVMGTAPAGVGGLGANPTNPGAHANYLANTAKCGMCHSVHRATATAGVGGNKLLPTSDATCSGCHTGGTAVTAKIITVAAVDTNWIPTYDGLGTEYDNITNIAAAGGGGGPHNDSAANLIEDGYWDGVAPTPAPSFAHGERYGCFTRRCHATNPHGAGASKYKLFSGKLLFNDSPAEDAVTYGTAVNSYGGEDTVWDFEGATDAAVDRFVLQNASIMATTASGDITVNGTTVVAGSNEAHALVAGLTCGRPSNPGGYDECHAEASYAIVDKGITEYRNHATGIKTPGEYATDNTGEEVIGFGGNDNRDLKTGHVAGTFAAQADHASYAAIAGCTSCHDQTDAANTEPGHVTFPHGQTPTGATNLVLADGTTMATGTRSRIWSGYGAFLGAPRIVSGTNEKAFDGQCLKCHRDASNAAGIGLTN